MMWLIACVFILTGVAVYFPTVFIRKTNRILAVLEKIEANTRTAQSGKP